MVQQLHVVMEVPLILIPQQLRRGLSMPFPVQLCEQAPTALETKWNCSRL
jgi:hypothetical protein